VVEKRASEPPLHAMLPRLTFTGDKAYILSTTQNIQSKASTAENQESAFEQRLTGEIKLRFDGFELEFGNQKPFEKAPLQKVQEAKTRGGAGEVETAVEKRAAEEKAGASSIQQKEKVQPKVSLEEKSPAQRKKLEKEQSERPIQVIGDRHLEAIKAIKEAGTLLGIMAGAGITAPTEMGRQTAKITDKVDMKKTGEGDSMRVVDELKGDKEKFYKDGGSEDTRRREAEKGQVDRKSDIQKPRVLAEEEAAVKVLKRDTVHLEKAVEQHEIKERIQHDMEQTVATQKEAPVRQAREAVKQAATSIESVIKKSQSEMWTGDEMAAKLIYLLMKASSTFTF